MNLLLVHELRRSIHLSSVIVDNPEFPLPRRPCPVKCFRPNVAVQDTNVVQLTQSCHGWLLVLAQLLQVRDCWPQTAGCSERLKPRGERANHDQGGHGCNLLAGQVSERLHLPASQTAPTCFGSPLKHALKLPCICC